MSDVIRYIALLRGINVGGRKKIKMADLRTMFSNMGFANAKTVLATGNIGFDTQKTDPSQLKTQISEEIKQAFGHDVNVLIRTQANIQTLVNTNPFTNIDVTENTRLYVSFLSSKAQHSLEIPYIAPAHNFTILQVSDDTVCSVLELSPKTRSTDSMKILEQEFGKNITTRNWNTVLKIADL